MMKKIAVAALFAATIAVPAAPVLAEPMTEHAHCLILPLLQADCREAMSEHVAMHTEAAEAHPLSPLAWMRCERAPEGAGYLFVCD